MVLTIQILPCRRQGPTQTNTMSVNDKLTHRARASLAMVLIKFSSFILFSAADGSISVYMKCPIDCINWCELFLIARFMGPTRDPPGADRTQVGPMWATWKLLSGLMCFVMKLENIYMSQIVLYFLHSTLVVSFYIKVILTLSIGCVNCSHGNYYRFDVFDRKWDFATQYSDHTWRLKHWQLSCMFNSLFRLASKKHVSISFPEENQLATGRFSRQRASKAKNVYIISWCHFNI